jgi:hypothetical protein
VARRLTSRPCGRIGPMARLDEQQFRESLGRLLRELLQGPAPDAAFMLNRGDRGLLASLAQLSAAQANAPQNGRVSVAAHVDHLRYGLSLLNRWARGDDPWADADFSASWKRLQVTQQQWSELLEALAAEASAWSQAIDQRREWDTHSLTETIASVVHLAYHLGAIRQIQPAAAGPPAKD